MIVGYVLISVILVSLLSLVAAIPFLFKKQVPKRILLLLVGLSIGTLLGVVFLHFLPELVEHGFDEHIGITILAGFLAFFLIEKLVHYHHAHHKTESSGHHHAYHLAPLNLIGEAVHNFIDGLVIAASYFVSIPLGIATTLSVALHELPQEIADLGILLYSGLAKKKAILFNLMAAFAALVGAVVGIAFFRFGSAVHDFALPFAAGVFLYIAAASLVPELHKERNILESALQFVAILFGIALMMMLGH